MEKMFVVVMKVMCEKVWSVEQQKELIWEQIEHGQASIVIVAEEAKDGELLI
jgi:hypothetical protein